MLPRRALLAVGVCLGTLTALHASSLSSPAREASDDRTIAAWVDAHNDAALTLLERAVNINSGTQNLAGVRQVGALFRAELYALGFTTRWVDGSSFGRAGHHGNAASGFVDHDFDESPPFLSRETGEFAGGPVRVKAVYTALDQPRDQAAQLGFIDLSRVIDRRQQGYENPLEFGQPSGYKNPVLPPPPEPHRAAAIQRPGAMTHSQIRMGAMCQDEMK